MSTLRQLTTLANQFYTRAQATHNVQLEQYFDRMIREMLGLAHGAEASVKHLLSMPKYSQSKGLQGMLQELPNLLSALSEMSHQEPGRSLANVEGTLNGMSFYTSKGNAGTGFDPATTVSEGGYTPPAYYVSTLSKMVQQMKSKIPADGQTPNVPKPQVIG